MNYTPTTWNTGDTVTASAMNKIENGIANAKESDAEIRIYHDNNSSHGYELTILSGSYNAIKEKTMNNIPPLVKAYIWDELSSYRGTTTMTSIYVFPNEVQPDNSFIFTVKMPVIDPSSHTNWFGISIEWNSEDELVVW